MYRRSHIAQLPRTLQLLMTRNTCWYTSLRPIIDFTPIIQSIRNYSNENTFALVPTPEQEKNNVIKNENTDSKSFFQEHLGKQISDALLTQFRIKKPSPIQEAAIPLLLRGHDVMLAAQTGTGKTLAYLLPLLYLMKKDEANGSVRRENRPKFVIVVPSRELVGQIGTILKSLSHELKFRTVILRSDLKLSRLKRDLNTLVDVVVTTPGILDKLHGIKSNNPKHKHIFFTDIKYVVFDEADTLFGGNFKQSILENLVIPLKSIRENHKVQFAFALATVNREANNFLDTHFSDIKKIRTNTLHAHLPNIERNFIKVDGNDKLASLIPILKEENEKHANNIHYQVMIFCRSVKSCRAVHHAVVEADLASSCYHSEMPPELQAEEFNRFKDGKVKFIVTTDLAARGIDIPNVKHVIMFDFPLNVVDYLHRSGRTGRLDQNSGTLTRGKVTCLLNRKREVALAEQISNAIRTKKTLDAIVSGPRMRIMGKQSIKKPKSKRQQYWMANKDRLKARQKIQEKKLKKGQQLSKSIQGWSWKKKVSKGLDPTKQLIDTISIPNPASKMAKQKRKENMQNLSK